MNANAERSLLACVLWSAVLALMTVAAPLTHAATLWTGPNIHFAQSPANPTSVDTLIPGVVSLTRAGSRWLYNPAGGDVGPNVGTPSDTEWAFGSLTNFASLTYKSFDSYRNGNLAGVLLPNKPMVLHIISQDIYLSLTFTAWPHGGGPFAYTRSTPGDVLPTPTVNITNPVSGAVFAAPAAVRIAATVTVAGGAVTNMTFFGNGAPLGVDQTAPFSITPGSLTAGPYALTAVATASGVSATSSVVNITVVSPAAITLTSQTSTNNQFSFDYTADPGLRYVVQNSSNLVDWFPLVTNVASSNPVHFSDGFIPSGDRYYRVGRLPNP
jgi:hypothetical protein